MSDPRSLRRRRPAGFTLVELLVSMTVFLGILVAVLAMFNFNYKLARVQTHVADMQQSLRIVQHDMVRMVRMAGRGGLPRGTLATPFAVELDSNVPANHTISTTAPQDVLQGTDVLTVRGVFTTPFFQVNPAGANFTIDNPPTTGTVRLQNPNPTTGIGQSLEELAASIEVAPAVPDALLLVSPLDDSIFAVVETNPGGSSVERSGSQVTAVTLAFNVVAKYLPLSAGGVYPPALTNVAFAGILEEYRFYVREAYAVAGDDTSELVPRLTMARFFPGTEVAYANDASNLQVDLADNILDFQVALGIDTNNNQQIDENAVLKDDEWLYNHDTDDDTQARWDQVPGAAVGTIPPIFYVRLTTLARTDRPDFQYTSPPLLRIEDRVYNEPANPPDQATLERRRYRRWRLETIVDMRNV